MKFSLLTWSRYLGVLMVMTSLAPYIHAQKSSEESSSSASTASTGEEGALNQQEQTIVLDRHNYFRMTALPYQAGNMMKIQWSEDLAGEAAADSKTCSATSGAGINAHIHSGGDDSTIKLIDVSFQQWVVDPALESIASLKPPSQLGEPIGTDIYNSYSQIVWAVTKEVGCAYASCENGAKKAFVCKYSPVGNTPGAPWYVHDTQCTSCPDGTECKIGLCVASDAPETHDAEIPAGEHTYEVFGDFIPEMTGTLTGSTTPSNAPAASSVSPAPSNAPAASSASPASSTKTPPSLTPKSSPNATVSIPPKPTHDSSSESSSGSTASSAAGSTSSESSDSGADVSTITPQPTTDSTQAPATDAGAPPVVGEADGSVPPATVTDSANDSGGATGKANNQASQQESPTVSATGVAGLALGGCIMMCCIAVIVSYRRNQRRQQDIIAKGGM